MKAPREEHPRPCGCVFITQDGDCTVEYCPRHKPAWRVGVEAMIHAAEARARRARERENPSP